MKNILNKKKNLFYFVLLALGLIFGLIFVFFISDLDKYVIKNGLSEYLSLINGKSYSYTNGLVESIKTNFFYLTIIWISGMLFIFIPIIFFVIFYKGFILGFMISSFILNYKIKGLLYSFLFIFPHEALNILVIVIFSIYALNFAKRLASTIYKNENINLRKVLKRYFIVYLIFMFFCFISSLVEIYISSFLLRLFV